MNRWAKDDCSKQCEDQQLDDVQNYHMRPQLKLTSGGLK